MSIITEDIPDIDFSNNPFNEWDDDLKTQIRVDDRGGDCILKGPIYVADENGRIIK